MLACFHDLVIALGCQQFSYSVTCSPKIRKVWSVVEPYKYNVGLEKKSGFGTCFILCS